MTDTWKRSILTRCKSYICDARKALAEMEQRANRKFESNLCMENALQNSMFLLCNWQLQNSEFYLILSFIFFFTVYKQLNTKLPSLNSNGHLGVLFLMLSTDISSLLCFHKYITISYSLLSIVLYHELRENISNLPLTWHYFYSNKYVDLAP